MFHLVLNTTLLVAFPAAYTVTPVNHDALELAILPAILKLYTFQVFNHVKIIFAAGGPYGLNEVCVNQLVASTHVLVPKALVDVPTYVG